MRTDYFDDLLPDSVTSVTGRVKQPVTVEINSKAKKDSELHELLPVLPVLPEKTGNTEQDEAIREHLAERAAIQEYDGGLTREQAEGEARRALRVFHYCLTDNPESWLVLIAPGCDVDGARRSLRMQFGGRLIDVKDYKWTKHE